MRLVESPHYADVALSVYMKIKALGQRPEGCTAGAAVLASYLGVSRSSVERGIAQLRRPGPDGVIELPVNRRRSLPGGCGTTAQRRVRPMHRDERFIWLPVAACEDLSPRQLRAYAVLCFAQTQRIPLTEGELAGHLYHHSGACAGTTLSATSAGKVVDALEDAGWVSVLRRSGVQGRHQFIAHDVPPAPGGARPLSPVESTSSSSQLDEGSGLEAGEGSLATREDHRIDRPDDERRPDSPAVGEVQVDKGARPVDNSGSNTAHDPAQDGFALRAGQEPPRSQTSPASRGHYDGPQLTLHPRIVEVLEPVQVLYEQANTFMQRRIAREVGRQLDHGCAPDRLRQRLRTRFAGVFLSDVKDPARWLMGVALPRWGCGHLACESGVMWPSGEPCAACADIRAARLREREREHRIERGQCPDHGLGGPGVGCTECAPPRRRRPVLANAAAPPAPAALSVCRECGCRIRLVGPALVDQMCRPCREAGQPAQPVAQPPGPAPRCSGWLGETCDRPAIPTRRVCARHRASELRAEAAG
ncbi:hypothetical protein ACFFSH_28845 [Streptomyces filamentosus]|uniref:Uncharacterized protein n=1 Tax=Streptomyces filamentosus TaxID=67294 RepID=A0A919ESV3_STRFL|nr:hypothetical protein [Streptomyces filamentosus]GHG22830.1 hypothetical protein GCM10017667_68530 [Streptomyces filamentosus]